MIFDFVLALTIGVSPAHAGAKGLVVRLETRGTELDAPVTVVLVPTAGDEVSIILADDGAPPDVNASDGVWSGTAWADGDVFTVKLTASGASYAGGQVSWKEEDVSRDLTIKLSGDTLELSADVAPVQGAGGGAVSPSGPAGVGVDMAPPSPGDPPTEGAAPPTEGAAPLAEGVVSPGGDPGPGAAPSGTGSPGPVTVAPGNPGVTDSDRTDPGTLYIAFGVGLVCLAGVGWLWARSRSSAAAALLRLPEAGIFGAFTPPLGEGPLHLVVAPADRDAALPLVLQTLATFHPVIVVGYTPAPVAGGPAYRTEDTHPAAIGDAAEGLLAEGRSPVVLLVPGPTGDSLAEWKEMLPKGATLVGVVEALEEGAPAVILRREGDQWFAEAGGRAVALRSDPTGLSASA